MFFVIDASGILN